MEVNDTFPQAFPQKFRGENSITERMLSGMQPPGFIVKATSHIVRGIMRGKGLTDVQLLG